MSPASAVLAPFVDDVTIEFIESLAESNSSSWADFKEAAEPLLLAYVEEDSEEDGGVLTDRLLAELRQPLGFSDEQPDGLASTPELTTLAAPLRLNGPPRTMSAMKVQLRSPAAAGSSGGEEEEEEVTPPEPGMVPSALPPTAMQQAPNPPAAAAGPSLPAPLSAVPDLFDEDAAFDAVVEALAKVCVQTYSP
jgi:hypothetical protein